MEGGIPSFADAPGLESGGRKLFARNKRRGLCSGLPKCTRLCSVETYVPSNRSATIKTILLIDLHRAWGAFRDSEHPFSVGIGQRRNCAVSQLWSVDIVQLLVRHGRGGLFRG